ncbi:MAG: carboxypeptidase-like regulatory domain-containing protein, partial [Candidatus Acidiferrales bacterium]
MPRRLSVGSILAVLIFAGSMGIAAQELATLNVTVTDESGAVIPQASIALRNMETDAKRGRISSAAGVAVIPGLPAGNYELTVEASRFAAYKSPLTLTVGQIASFTAVLAVQGVTQQVAVHETEQGVDTGKSDVSQVIDTQNISDLPIAGRDFIDFVLLTP